MLTRSEALPVEQNQESLNTTAFDIVASRHGRSSLLILRGILSQWLMRRRARRFGLSAAAQRACAREPVLPIWSRDGLDGCARDEKTPSAGRARVYNGDGSR